MGSQRFFAVATVLPLNAASIRFQPLHNTHCGYQASPLAHTVRPGQGSLALIPGLAYSVLSHFDHCVDHLRYWAWDWTRCAVEQAKVVVKYGEGYIPSHLHPCLLVKKDLRCTQTSFVKIRWNLCDCEWLASRQLTSAQWRGRFFGYKFDQDIDASGVMHNTALCAPIVTLCNARWTGSTSTSIRLAHLTPKSAGRRYTW